MKKQKSIDEVGVINQQINEHALDYIQKVFSSMGKAEEYKHPLAFVINFILRPAILLAKGSQEIEDGADILRLSITLLTQLAEDESFETFNNNDLEFFRDAFPNDSDAIMDFFKSNQL